MALLLFELLTIILC